ncbi:DNA repair protein RecO [Aquirhabdus sp.]|uniref:DNA repair protein RecO n=1 Tax=Aquirhabdus sp. TaxID=2824160 RepID=UPI00396CF9B1
MRNEPLHGYVLHQRAYRENSKLVNFLSFEAGRVDGITRQSIPSLYQPTLLFATGKSALKTFAKAETVGTAKILSGDALFAGFYLNELLVRLLPHQEPLPTVVTAYTHALQALADQQSLIATLRRFELVLLSQLGYAIDFKNDRLGVPIQSHLLYRYQRDEGFALHTSGETGASLLAMGDLSDEVPLTLSVESLPMLTRVLRNALAAQLGDKPLKSRALWISNKTNISN